MVAGRFERRGSEANGKYGIIADVHGNLPALSVALDYLDRVGVDKILCLGDVVDEVGSPDACLGMLEERSHMIHYVAGERERNARMMGREAATLLKQLPERTIIDDEIALVHGSLVDRDAYLVSDQEIARNLECMTREFPGVKVCLYGHSHFPMLVATKAVIRGIKETKSFQLDRNGIYLINPGAVGQPRDKCPLAAFGIFDAARWIMTFVRRPYDGSTGR